MKILIGNLLFIGLLFLSACSPKLSPFSQRLVDQNAWEEEDLKEIQFYLSDDVVLRRDFSNLKAFLLGYFDGLRISIDGS